MKLITSSLVFSLVLLTSFCVLPVFAVPAVPGMTDISDDSGQPVPLLGHISRPRGVLDPRLVAAGQNANEAITRGEALHRQGKTEAALSAFKNAMQYIPNDPLALERIAETYASAGRVVEADRTYHSLFTEARWQSVGGSPTVYLGYALVLAKLGHSEPAKKFYDEGAAMLNYMDGKKNLKLSLPLFGSGADPLPYTPQRLEALAETAIAQGESAFGDEKEALAHLHEAAYLYPDSPIVQFYLGEQLHRMQKKGDKAAYAKAAALGDEQVGAAVEEAMKVYH